MFKKGIAMLLAIVMLFGGAFSSSAAEISVPEDMIIGGNAPEIQPMYNYTSKHSESLSISGGMATCKATLIGKSGVTTKFTVKMILQKKTLLWWSEVETWIVTYLYDSETTVRTTSVGSGTYRVKAIYTVYSGTKSESITAYSSEKSC